MVVSKILHNGKISDLSELIDGRVFFRKIVESNGELAIAKIIMANPHPNIVKIYRITETYYDMELLKAVSDMFRTRVNMAMLRRDMLRAKTHLQGLGIMYIDWKLDNTGLDSKGHYRLFDFDASGLISAAGDWLICAPEYISWNNALAAGKRVPKDIDDYIFTVEIIST
jgi:hypothetical protein